MTTLTLPRMISTDALDAPWRQNLHMLEVASTCAIALASADGCNGDAVNPKGATVRKWAEKTCEQSLSVAAEGALCVRVGMRTNR